MARRVTAADVRTAQFRVVFRGYDIRAVDAFLDEVERELQRLGEAKPGGRDPSGRDLDLPARAVRTLRLADQMADQAVASAMAEADQIRAQAAAEVAKTVGLVNELQAEVERLEALELAARERIEAVLRSQLDLLQEGSLRHADR